MGGKMVGRIRRTRLGIFLNASLGIVFIIAAIIVVITVNFNMRQQALIEAESKARIILDRNLATHTYFSQIMKPSILAWSKPFRPKEYFDHTWMSSFHAIREIEKYFKSISPSRYSFRDAAINARSPENEADEYERAFIEKMALDKKLESESTIRNIDGKPYLIVLKKGEVMEASCLRCHSNPQDAPKELTDYYGSERSFNRKTGDAVHAVSLRIPLSEAYAAVYLFSWKLSAILLIVLACLFTIQYWFYRRYLLQPLNVIRDKANKIATHEDHLGEQIPQPFGRELSELTTTFNEMSVKVCHERDHLEDLVDQRTEALLREKFFAESLVQTAQAIVLVLDTTGCIVSFNQYMEEISGYRLEEVQGKDWFSTFLPERDRKRIRESFLKATADIQTRGNVDPIVTKDGREVDIEWYDKTLKDEQGNVTGLLSIGQDVTSRKRAEKALRESEERLRTVVEASLDAIIAVNAEGRLVLFNGAAQEVFQYCKEEALNQPADILLREEIGKIHQERLEKFLNTGVGRCGHIGRRMEKPFRRKDGSLFEAEVSMSGGRLDGLRLVVLVIHDITERRQAEDSLHRSEENFRRSLDESPLGLRIRTIEGDTLYANRAILDIYGYNSIEELNATPVKKRYTPESYAEFQIRREKRRRGDEGPYEFEISIVRKDGEVRHLKVFRKRILWNGEEQFQTIYQDITERKRAEIRLARLNDCFLRF